MKLSFFVFLTFISTVTLGQHRLSGKILDAQTQQGISDASIYFTELHRGTASSADGTFELNGLKKGRLLVQVSHIGYETFFSTLIIHADTVLEIALRASRTEMKEVVITGTQSQSPQETSFNVSQLNLKEMQQSGALNISEAVSRLPGVSQLTTGPGITKPVIRGLYGNRIQVNVNGIRFDNQQWQDEHGLGLSDIGVDQVEIIRGPISVLYGSDALGGVLNIIDEKPAAVNTTERDLSTRLYSNTYGLSVNYGSRKSTQDKWKNFRVGFDNHADYSDGNNDRVLNSRFASYNIKAGWGKNKEHSVHALRVSGSFSEFGFVFDSLSRKEEDHRLARNFDGPHHIVGFGQITSTNTYYNGNKKIKVNGGFITNLRMEDEGGGGISLSMLLNTLNGIAQVTQPVGKFGEWTYGGSFMFQTNTNFGGRIIVPDAATAEISAQSFYKRVTKKWLFEAGARFDYRYLGTFATSTLNVDGSDSPTQEITPFTNFYKAWNISTGASYNLTRQLSVGFNASTGYRPGNLAELSSNGLHEGTLRWEIGLPDAKIEQNLNLEGSLRYHSAQFQATASVYQNRFWNYFYLNPTGQEYYGFAIYQYEQSDAVLKGGEASLEWNPEWLPVDLLTAYTAIRAEKEDGSYLPFVPANKINSEIHIHFKSIGKLTTPEFRFGNTYVFDQDRPAQFETATAAYSLLFFGVTGQWKKASLSLTCNNLLNKHYYDHLSRFKYYGIANMGRNIVLGINFKL